MGRKRNKNNEYRHNIVWGEYDAMVKRDYKHVILRDWWVFNKIDERDERRRNRYVILTVGWWILFGSLAIISLIYVLIGIYEWVFPLGEPNSFWNGIFALILFVYFGLSIGSYSWLLKIKRDIYDTYQKEVYTFFNRYYKEAEKKFDDWKVSQLEQLISVSDGLSMDPYLENAGLMEEIAEMKADYKESLKELESILEYDT